MNLPQDFSRNMELLLGREAFLRLAEALDEPARVAFRPNDGKGFRVAGTLAAVPWSSYGHYLNERPAFTFSPRCLLCARAFLHVCGAGFAYVRFASKGARPLCGAGREVNFDSFMPSAGIPVGQQ